MLCYALEDIFLEDILDVRIAEHQYQVILNGICPILMDVESSGITPPHPQA